MTAAPSAPPSPGARGGSTRNRGVDLLLYDDDCGVCTAGAELARRIDRGGRFQVRGSHTLSELELEALGLTRARCNDALQLVTAAGRRRSGAHAVNAFLWTTGGPGRFVVLLYLLPPLLLLEWVAYALVARNRFTISRWLGLAACRAPGV